MIVRRSREIRQAEMEEELISTGDKAENFPFFSNSGFFKTIRPEYVRSSMKKDPVD